MNTRTTSLSRFTLTMAALLLLQPMAAICQENAATQWSTAGAVYADDVLAVGDYTKNTRATDFKPDGSLLYVLGRTTGNVAVFELATPWQIGSGSFKASLNLGNEVGQRRQQKVPHGLFIRKDTGSRLFIWNRTEAFAYDLATPWDITTARLRHYKFFGEPIQRAHDIDISPDGANLYIDDRGAGRIFQYQMREPWNIESAEYLTELDISKVQQAVRGIEFTPDGKRFFFLDTAKRCIFEFDLATAWMLATARPGSVLDINDRFKNPRGLTWRPDGTAFYITETRGETIHAYHIQPSDK